MTPRTTTGHWPRHGFDPRHPPRLPPSPAPTRCRPAEPQQPTGSTGSADGAHPHPVSFAQPHLEDSMSTATFASASTFRPSPRRPLTVMALFGLLVLGLGVAFPGHALDLVGFVGIAGPMTSALAQIAAL